MRGGTCNAVSHQADLLSLPGLLSRISHGMQMRWESLHTASQPKYAGILELLLNTPSASHRPGHHFQRGASRAEDQVIGLFCGMRWDATNVQPLLSVVAPFDAIWADTPTRKEAVLSCPSSHAKRCHCCSLTNRCSACATGSLVRPWGVIIPICSVEATARANQYWWSSNQVRRSRLLPYTVSATTQATGICA